MDTAQVDEAINLIVLDDVQRLNQQFIHNAIRLWDARQVSSVPFWMWIKLSVDRQWQEMSQRN